jgi:protein SCO1/2
MRTVLLTVLLGCVAAAACSSPEPRRFPIRGQVVAVDPDRSEVTLKHEKIEGFMDAMTMPFKVRDKAVLDTLAAHDFISATLVVDDASATAFLEGVTKTGTAPASPSSEARPPASSGFELLRIGDAVPDAVFVDQDGRTRRFSETRGKATAMTFIYTRCPLPTFCPLMDRQFADIQRQVKGSSRLRDRVRLLSVSFDPAFDTPAVLKAHASMLDADPATWSFLTGDRDEIDRFAARFGVTVTRSQTDPSDIAHNLRTVVVDERGHIAHIYKGFDWKPDQIVADLQTLASAR